MKTKTNLSERELYQYCHEYFVYDFQTGKLLLNKKRHSKKEIGDEVGCIGGMDGYQYKQVKIKGTLYMVHKIIWLMVYGEMPRFELDHINRNRFDNNINNLREATHSSNCFNQIKKSKYGVKGVSKDRVGIRVDIGRKFYGYFNTLNDAKEFAKSKSVEVHGEFSPYYKTPVNNCNEISRARKTRVEKSFFTLDEASEILEMRDVLNLTNKELTKLIGCSKATTSRLVNNQLKYFKDGNIAV